MKLPTAALLRFNGDFINLAHTMRISSLCTICAYVHSESYRTSGSPAISKDFRHIYGAQECECSIGLLIKRIARTHSIQSKKKLLPLHFSFIHGSYLLCIVYLCTINKFHFFKNRSRKWWHGLMHSITRCVARKWKWLPGRRPRSPRWLRPGLFPHG